VAAGCLPRGEPPAGRQVISDRSTSLAGILPAASDGVVRLLVVRVHDDRVLGDLYVVAVGNDGTPPTETLLAQNLGWGYGCNFGMCFIADPKGRVFVTHDYDPQTQLSSLARIDPITGARLELGMSSYTYFLTSPSGDRLVVPSYPFQSLTLYEADDRATTIADATNPLFLGEDLYYLVKQQMMRLAPNGAPVVVRDAVTSFSSQETDAGPVLVLTLGTDDPLVGTYAVMDPVTATDLFPPVDFRQSISVSPDRHWLLAADYTSNEARYTFIGDTGATEEIALPDTGSRGAFEWRPGRAQVWFQAWDNGTGRPSPTSWTKVPGMPLVEVPISVQAVSEGMAMPSFFTRDSAYVFSFRSAQVKDGLTLQVGSADDPQSPRFDAVPDGSTSFGYWRLADGRLVTAGFFHSPQRNEIRVVDPATGASQTLATEGTVVTVGERRVLVLQHMIDSRGDLRSFDTDTGASTLFGAEFTVNAFVEKQGADPDPVKPGAHIAFQFQARFDSPYDGIWVTTIP